MTRILAIIPARGQSKGIPKKNIVPLAGKPLIAWTITCALAAAGIDRTIVSTDNEEIATVAREYGAEVPFIRPSALAQDNTPDLPVLQHVLDWLGDSERPEFVVWLRPTAPLRAPSDVETSLGLLAQSEFNCVRSITLAKHHPYWMKALHEDGTIHPFFEDKDETIYFRRQMLPPVYYLNGVVDVIRTVAVARTGVMFSQPMGGYVTLPERSVDIDTMADLQQAESYLMRGSLDENQ